MGRPRTITPDWVKTDLKPSTLGSFSFKAYMLNWSLSPEKLASILEVSKAGIYKMIRRGTMKYGYVQKLEDCEELGPKTYPFKYWEKPNGTI